MGFEDVHPMLCGKILQVLHAFLQRLPRVIDELWPRRNQSNVLILHYSDRLKDDRAEVNKIVKLMGVELTASELDAVIKKASFEEMKKIEDSTEGNHLYDTFIERGLVAPNMTVLKQKSGYGAMMSKGPKRKGKAELSSSMIAGIDSVLSEIFTPKMIKWIHEGGRLPVEEELLPFSSSHT
jgi:hypothetical protein